MKNKSILIENKLYIFIFIITVFYSIHYLKDINENIIILLYIISFMIFFFFGFYSSKNKMVSCLIFIFISLFIFIEYVTKRMTSFYFHDIPLEIISILYDTNLDEIKNNIFFSTIECVGIMLIICYIFILIKEKIKKKKEKRKLDILFSVIHIFIFFTLLMLTSNSFIKTIKKIKDNKNLIANTLDIIEKRNKFTWGAKSEIDEKQTVVIFLGETHRGDFLSINGYEKETTPRLKKRELISFTNAISQGAYTLISTPMIMSRKNVHNNGVFHEKSLISAFKEAGFKTWYVSYLSKTHSGDNEINLMANEADVYIRSSVSNKILSEILSDKSNKKLIVYKTVGSHYLYHVRYPKEYDFFKPSFTEKDYSVPSSKDKEKLQNNYANSVLYSVDKQVDDFISILEKESGLVSLSFISDHGTAIFDDNRSLYGGNTKGNYSIALFFWFNDLYKNKYNNDINLLNKNKNKKVTAEYFVDTMFQIGKLSTKIKKNKSLFDEDLIEKKRMVKNHNILDYDKDI
ncbi:MAG TPA: phosphoethanolamine transferase [Arsenophonus apicola]